MKYSFTLASTLAAVVMAAKPEFLNTSFDVVQGQPFTLEFSGCETGCTISLQTGSEDDLKDVKELSGSATGGSLTVTLDDVPTGTYNFKITNNESGEENYSLVFDYDGTPSETTPASTTSAPETTTATPTSTTEAETTTTPSSSSLSTTVTSASSSTSASETPSSTSSEEPSSTTRPGSAPTTPPDSAAGRLGSPAGLALGAVAAMVVLA